MPAISTSTATRSARWSARSPSAARGCRARGRRPAARIICAASAAPPRPARSCPKARKVTATELADNLPDPALGGWSTRPDRIAILRKHLRGKGAQAIAAAAATDFGPVDLPGPTGEANTLTLLPRGRVLCLGPDADTLLAQAMQALAAGNAVLAVAPGAPAALQPLHGKGLPLAAIDGAAGSGRVAVAGGRRRGFLRHAEAMRVVRQALAERNGPDRAAGDRDDLSGRLCA